MLVGEVSLGNCCFRGVLLGELLVECCKGSVVERSVVGGSVVGGSVVGMRGVLGHAGRQLTRAPFPGGVAYSRVGCRVPGWGALFPGGLSPLHVVGVWD